MSFEVYRDGVQIERWRESFPSRIQVFDKGDCRGILQGSFSIRMLPLLHQHILPPLGFFDVSVGALEHVSKAVRLFRMFLSQTLKVSDPSFPELSSKAFATVTVDVTGEGWRSCGPKTEGLWSAEFTGCGCKHLSLRNSQQFIDCCIYCWRESCGHQASLGGKSRWRKG